MATEIREGRATRTDPGAGQLVDRAEPNVVLFISEGPEPFAMPTFVNLTPDDAELQAAQAGLDLRFGDPIEVSLDSGLAGRVAAQDPPAGSEVFVGDIVVVNIGQLRQVEVPDLFGMTEQEAEILLDGIGLELDVVGVVPNDDPELGNRIVGQDPPEGELVDEGSEIQVQIGEVPDVPPTTSG